MESQPQNTEFRIYPENFYPCLSLIRAKVAGQSRGQPDWVHGFPELVKSFKTFIILSQILSFKVQKKPSYFSAQHCVKVSPPFAEVFKITSTN